MREEPIHCANPAHSFYFSVLTRWPPVGLSRRPAVCEDAAMGLHSANPLSHRLAEGVRLVGFRKWYERELLSSHAHMVLCVLATIGLLGSFEALRDAGAVDRFLNVVFILACTAIGVWALRRYLFLLGRAEEAANQASCGDCGEYGRFQVVAENRVAGGTEVCCRRCAHHWTISLDR